MDPVKILVESGPTILIEKPLANWLRFCCSNDRVGAWDMAVDRLANFSNIH